MKIAHVITRLIVGGAQENTILSCGGLVAKCHNVALIAGTETGPEGSLWDHAERSGADLIRLDSLRRNVHPYHDARCLAELTDIFRRGKFDIVHTHSSKGGILGRWAAARAGVRGVVHTIHGMSFNRTQPAIVRWTYRTLEQLAAQSTHAFVTVADAMIDQAVAGGLGARQAFTTVYSGMPTERYVRSESQRESVRKQWGATPRDIVVGTVARLFRNKGYEDLLDALPSVIARVPNVRFVWIGDGADRDAYLRRLDGMGARHRVHLTGLVSPDDIPTLMNGIDILVHASRWEGLARVLVQALLMEVPVVSYDNDGAPEVVEDGQTGVLVPFGHTKGLADGIATLAASQSLRKRLGQEGRKRCVDRFSVDRMVTDLEHLYERILTEPRP